MEYLPTMIIIVLLAAVFCLLAKLFLLRRALKDVVSDLREKLCSDTNTRITTASSDRAVRKLAAELNTELSALRAQKLRLDNRNTELQNAVTNLSHDLRTPLTAISGYLDLLDREEKSDTVTRYLSHIRNRTEALKGLTEELFRYSVVTSQQTLKREPVNLVRALEESLVSFYGAMQERGIQPEIHLPESPVWRELDAGALSRVFSNIISNAIKYSDGDFTVEMKEDGEITFANTAADLSAVEVGRMFDRFYTVEAGRNSTGLGLSIAKLLTERMGGRIEAEYQHKCVAIRLVFM